MEKNTTEQLLRKISEELPITTVPNIGDFHPWKCTWNPKTKKVIAKSKLCLLEGECAHVTAKLWPGDNYAQIALTFDDDASRRVHRKHGLKATFEHTCNLIFDYFAVNRWLISIRDLKLQWGHISMDVVMTSIQSSIVERSYCFNGATSQWMW
jgi:hypothetical protein